MGIIQTITVFSWLLYCYFSWGKDRFIDVFLLKYDSKNHLWLRLLPHLFLLCGIGNLIYYIIEKS